MMKLSIMSLSYQREFAAGRLDLAGFLDLCRELDADGVDLNTRSFRDESAAALLAIKEQCLRLGLVIACLSIPNNFAKPAAQLPDELALTKGWIDNALLLGAPQVRVFAGRPPAGEPREAASARCRAALKAAADYGHERGVAVALQNHNHGALTETGDDVLRFIAEAGPHLRHVWDTGQYVGSPGASGADPEAGGQEQLYRSLQQTVNLATHVRCKFYRVASGVEQWLDYPRILAMLRAAGYNGFCSVVYEGRGDERADVPKAVSYLRSLLQG